MTTSSKSISTQSKLHSLKPRQEPDAILMCDPTYFQVIDVKNAFMEGQVGQVNNKIARKQWSALKKVFEKLGYPVEVVTSQPKREDMVFTANQVLLGKDKKLGKYVVLSRMIYPSRQKEVPFFTKWFKKHNYKILELSTSHKGQPIIFEGEGDALWHPETDLLWAAYGHRTTKNTYSALQNLISSPINVLSLVHPTFYHLDTAFCPLDKDTVMIFPKAFSKLSLELIYKYFSKVIAVSAHDAHNFACNALALGKNVILQKGSVSTCKLLKKHGFNPVEVDTSEFMKSGGSVSCLKMMIYKS